MDLASGQALALRRRTNRICSVFWTPTVVPAKSSLLTSSTIRKAAALHAHIYYFSLSLLFFFLPTDRSRVGRASVRMLLYLPPHPKHTYYYYMLVSMRNICSSYIYMYTYYYLLLRAYIYIWTHCHTRAHIHIHYIAICVLVYIHTITHI